MTFYEDLVMQTQANYSRYHSVYAAGDTPYALTERAPLPYAEQIDRLARELAEADCVVVGGASGLSAAGGRGFLLCGQCLLSQILWQIRGEVPLSGSL